MEAAAERALLMGACRYQSVKSILKNSLDTVHSAEPPPSPPPPPRDDIRDAEYKMRSLIFTSRLPVSRWHEHIGDPTFGQRHPGPAEIRGDSMRKNRGKPNA